MERKRETLGAASLALTKSLRLNEMSSNRQETRQALAAKQEQLNLQPGEQVIPPALSCETRLELNRWFRRLCSVLDYRSRCSRSQHQK